jgi:hypothetical protein
MLAYAFFDLVWHSQSIATSSNGSQQWPIIWTGFTTAYLLEHLSDHGLRSVDEIMHDGCLLWMVGFLVHRKSIQDSLDHP